MIVMKTTQEEEGMPTGGRRWFAVLYRVSERRLSHEMQLE